MRERKFNINIHLAEHAPISLVATANEEAMIREAERQVNNLWQSWCRQFKAKTKDEVMAMVAFRFAQLYFERRRDIDDARATLQALDKALDDALKQAMA